MSGPHGAGPLAGLKRPAPPALVAALERQPVRTALSGEPTRWKVAAMRTGCSDCLLSDSSRLGGSTEPCDEPRHETHGDHDDGDAGQGTEHGNHNPDHHTKAAKPDLPDEHYWSRARRHHATIFLGDADPPRVTISLALAGDAATGALAATDAPLRAPGSQLDSVTSVANRRMDIPRPGHLAACKLVSTLVHDVFGPVAPASEGFVAERHRWLLHLNEKRLRDRRGVYRPFGWLVQQGLKIREAADISASSIHKGPSLTKVAAQNPSGLCPSDRWASWDSGVVSTAMPFDEDMTRRGGGALHDARCRGAARCDARDTGPAAGRARSRHRLGARLLGRRDR